MVELFQNLRLASPAWLGALLLLPLVVVAVRGSLARESALRRAASLALRVAALALLVLVLSSPVSDRVNQVPWVALLVDQSESVSEKATGAAESFVEVTLGQTNPDDVVIVPFSSEPGQASVGAWPPVSSGSPGTDLVAALESVPAVPRSSGPARIVLLSDGNATLPGNVPSAASALQAPVDTVPLAPEAGPDIWIVSVIAPNEVRPGDPIPVIVNVESNAEGNATLSVTCRGEEVSRKDVAVTQGQGAVPIELELGPGPRDDFRVCLESHADSRDVNNWAEFAVWHEAPPRALLVGSDARQFSRFSRVLGGQAIEVETITADSFPQKLADLAPFDLVVLSDVPATEFSAEQLAAIEQYVHDKAGGLIAFGGQNSLTAGHYRETALERILPVTCEFDLQAKRPSLAMVLAIDQSGSMEEGNAIGLAKTALRQTVQMLDAEDELGVIAFQDTTNWIVPLQPCGDKEKVFAEIETLQAGGGTNMHPAIGKAHLALHEAFADLKHIIVLTDGISYPGDFDTLASEVAASGITISTVAVGSEAAEPLLKTIAELGGGNYHHCTSAEEVPEIFVRETAKAARMGIREEPFFPKADTALASVAALPDAKPPALLGYVQTKARSEAQVGMVSERGDPLAAWWPFGRGRSAVFTSELRGPWTRPWQTWPGLEPLWDALVRQTIRPANLDGYRLQCRREEGQTLITLDALPYPGRFENEAEVTVEVTSPDEAKEQAIVPRVAPGQYSVRVATPEWDVYDFEVTCRVASETVFQGRCSSCPTYSAEWIPRETNEPLLQELARETGGKFNPSPGNAFGVKDVPSVETRGVWHYLLLAVVLLLIGELAIRRLR